MLTIITATDQHGLIGAAGRLPWHLPEELAFFKATTMGSTLVMGRKTFESIGRPLPGRKTVVLTRTPGWHHEGVITVGSVQEVLSLADEGQEVMVAGGAEVYDLLLPYTHRVVKSVVEGTYRGDAYFPVLSSDWEVVKWEKHAGFTVKVYEKRK